MSDLILNLNLDESKKNNRIIIETYLGTIPNLKSKKYSGQLRPININSDISCENISEIELLQVQEVLNSSANIQINKYQYYLGPSFIAVLPSFVKLGCLFYRNNKAGMFEIETLTINDKTNHFNNVFEIDEIICSADKTKLNIDVDFSKKQNHIVDIQPKAYINLNDASFPVELYFDYDGYIIRAREKSKKTVSGLFVRNYGYEQRIERTIISQGWVLKKSTGFTYIGKDIISAISHLSNSGIQVYTNTKKRIYNSDFSDVRVSYETDWFGVKGNVLLDNLNVNVTELLDLRKRHQIWVEYDGKIVLMPKALQSNSIKTDSRNKIAYISQDRLAEAIIIANDTNGRPVEKLDNLFNYENISYNIDPRITKIMRTYQLVGVKWLLSLRKNGFGACLADDMGLGKTLQIIAYLNDKTLKNSCNLIIVPKTLLTNWQREINRFSPDTTQYIYHSANRDINCLKRYNVVISTYQTLVNDIELLDQIHFDNLIIDEAQYAKNSKSKSYRALKRIDASTKIILTGTPVENNTNEFFSLMKLINPNIAAGSGINSKNINENIDKVRMVFSPFLLQRLKKDVLNDLPKKQEQTICIKMESEQQELYNKMLDSIRYEILRKNDRFEIKDNSIMLKGLLYLQEICCHPQLLSKELNNNCTSSAKLDLLMDLLESLYFNGHKVVIFSRFTKMLKLIEKQVVKRHYNYYYLDGSTRNKASVIDDFENSSKGIFLISLKAGGVGINLTSADTAVIYDPWWNPAAEKQAEDRLYRLGQKNSVMIYRLIVENSIEEKVQQLQNDKLQLYSELLDGHSVPVSLNLEMLKDLIVD